MTAKKRAFKALEKSVRASLAFEKLVIIGLHRSLIKSDDVAANLASSWDVALRTLRGSVSRQSAQFRATNGTVSNVVLEIWERNRLALEADLQAKWQRFLRSCERRMNLVDPFTKQRIRHLCAIGADLISEDITNPQEEEVKSPQEVAEAKVKDLGRKIAVAESTEIPALVMQLGVEYSQLQEIHKATAAKIAARLAEEESANEEDAAAA